MTTDQDLYEKLMRNPYHVLHTTWKILEIHFHAVLRKMQLEVVSYVLEIKYFMSYGWINIDIVTTVAHSVHYMPRTCLKMPMQLINCNVNNATVPHHTRTTSV